MVGRLPLGQLSAGAPLPIGVEQDAVGYRDAGEGERKTMKSAGYVSPEGLRKAAERSAHIKARTYELMRVEQGHRVLDVGCGPGVDTVALARLVGGTGRVVGVDVDEEMLAAARSHAEREGVASRIDHRQADIRRLPEADGSFDAVRAERLLQVVPSDCPPRDVVRELTRVAAKGGRIVLADADWASASVDYPDYDLERRMMGFFAGSMRPNGVAGRQLFRLLLAAGAHEVRAEVCPMLLHDYDQTPFGPWLVGEATKHGIASSEEGAQWLATLKERSADGRFLATVNILIVAGIKE